MLISGHLQGLSQAGEQATHAAAPEAGGQDGRDRKAAQGKLGVRFAGGGG